MITTLLVMTCEISFGKTDLRKEIITKKVSSFTVSKSVDQLTARAEIVLSRNTTVFDKYTIQDLFKQGDPVTIRSGYDGLNHIVFSGYITSVSAEIPISIKCEDEMYQLKKTPVNYSKNNVGLKSLIGSIYKGKYKVLEDIEIGAVRLPNTTVAKVLDKLKDNPWNLRSIIDRDGTLIVGPAYSRLSDLPAAKIHMEKELASNSLTY